MLVAGQVSVSASQTGTDHDDQDALRVSNEVAEATDLALIADSHGWTLDEARERARTAELAGPLQAGLRQDFPDDFAGAFLGDDPTGPPTFMFAGVVPPGAAVRLATSGLHPNVMEGVGHSLARLEEDMLKAADTLRAHGYESLVSAVDQVANRVVISVGRVPGLPDRTREIMAEVLSPDLRESVVVRHVLEGPATTQTHTWR